MEPLSQTAGRGGWGEREEAAEKLTPMVTGKHIPWQSQYSQFNVSVIFTLYVLFLYTVNAPGLFCFVFLPRNVFEMHFK